MKYIKLPTGDIVPAVKCTEIINGKIVTYYEQADELEEALRIVADKYNTTVEDLKDLLRYYND